MTPYLLIDFGSTYTKMTVVDLDAPRILGTASALTTVNDGLMIGYRNALAELERQIGKMRFRKQLACSSAAGGLKMVVLGLVPELTVEAAKRAALGAGARVVKTYSFQLAAGEIAELISLKPDLVLLTGGTDGGNREVILSNGRLLAESSLEAPVIVAGNKTATAEIVADFTNAGKVSYPAANVLPELERLNVEPVQQTIRELFLRRIIHAKGLNQVLQFIDGITMPTPAAVLEAAGRLADGDGQGRPGLGELLIIDVGGATTDVHSVAEGNPANSQVLWRGIKESRVKRTVEGDLGMRYSLPALLEVFSTRTIAQMSGLSEAEVLAGIDHRVTRVAYLPQNQPEQELETVLGFLAVKGAVDRHVGRIEKIYTPGGVAYLQTGKDLTALKTVIGTGGILARSIQGAQVLNGVLYEPARPELLKPMAPDFYLDQRYVIPALGLIAKEYPHASLKLLCESLVKMK